MNLTKDDIKHMDTVGSHKGCDILHILTKGGLNLIVKKSAGGAFSVLSTAPHRAIAKHQADQTTPGIEWNDVLTKSEELYKAPKDLGSGIAIQQAAPVKQEARDTMGNPIYESNPQNHYDLAAFHSKLAGHHNAQQVHPGDSNAKMDRDMRILHASDTALRHYQMAGLNHKQAHEEHKKQMNYHKELPADFSAPFQDNALELAWSRSNPGKRPPVGLKRGFAD
jgi:hypothetical protein